jgi:DNA (cytosine-5)-methyltransferase 1
MKIGSLCTGYGGLDLAVEAHFNAETIWCAEFDKYASQVIEQRFDIPNYGDIKSIKWDEVEPIDILTAGYPCQPFSTAGARKGTEDERHIWPYIKEAISVLRPRYVILENVRGHLSLGFKEVLKGLAEIGYDARWQIVRASDAGAAHQRARLFIIAYPECTDTNSIRFSLEYDESGTQRNQGQSQSQSSELVKGVTHANIERLQRTGNETNDFADGGQTNQGAASATIPTNSSSPRFSQIIMDKFYKTNHRTRGGIALDGEPLTGIWWRDTAYEAAIERWQAIQGKPPSPLMGERLNPKFVEWMMGLPNGWVTECGLSVTQQLKMLGNGVVPQQAKLALELLTNGE